MYRQLRNGVSMPHQMMGLSFWEEKGDRLTLLEKVSSAVEYVAKIGGVGYDTARDYANEPFLGEQFHRIIQKGGVKREDLFITTKVGNSQQIGRDMQAEIDLSLKNLRVDYLDLWLLHWPYPDFWEENWKQMVDIYHSGKVRAIGIANARERHLEHLKNLGLPLPHVVQVECHPFRVVPGFREQCARDGIVMEAYSSSCNMLPFVRRNPVLAEIAASHGNSIAQVILKWHMQHGVIPIFRSFTIEHIKENINLGTLTLSDEEMRRIDALDEDYKFHPESLNCPGY